MPNRNSFIDQLRSNPYGWGNVPTGLEEPHPVLDEWGQPHDGMSGNPLYENSAPQKSAGESLHDIAMSPVNMAMEPMHALSRLAENGGFPNPSDPQNKQDMSALVMSMFGGNAFAPARAGEAVAARALSDTGKPSLMGSALAGAENQPVRAYHGTRKEITGKLSPSDDGDLGSGLYVGLHPDVADWYAGTGQQPRNFEGGSVLPLDVHTKLAAYPDYIQAIRAHGDESAAREWLSKNGYGGVSDHGQAVIWEPNSVKSATTGETLFSDTGKPSLIGSALAGAEGGFRNATNPRQAIDWSEMNQNILDMRANEGLGIVPMAERLGVTNSALKKHIKRNQDAFAAAGFEPIPAGGVRVNTPENMAKVQEYVDSGFDPNVRSTLGITRAMVDYHKAAAGTRWDGHPVVAQDIGSKIMEMRREGRSFAEIATETGKTRSAVAGYLNRRDKNGLLLSDTGKPSALGAAMAGAERQPINALYEQKGIASMAKTGHDIDLGIKKLDPNSLIFREEMQGNMDAVRELFPNEFFPIVVAKTEDGNLILDGHNRTAVAQERRVPIPAVEIPNEIYQLLKSHGYDETDISHAILARIGKGAAGEAASGIRQKFPGAGLEKSSDRINEIIDGTLFSDTGKPSVLGAAMAGAADQNQQPTTADLLAILHKHGVNF